MMQIDGTVVGIKAAIGGVGEAIAWYLAERGAKVVLGAEAIVEASPLQLSSLPA